MTTTETAACIHRCPCTSDTECPHDSCGARECPSCSPGILIEEIEWATGQNGQTLVEKLAEFGLVIHFR